MPYLQLSLPCPLEWQPRAERALEDVGALAVTLQDAHLDAADEQAIFEPGVGELPLWDEMTLTALFPDETDALVLLAALEAFDPGLDWHQARFEKVADQDWERAWLDTFQPMRFGARCWIVPWNHELPEGADADDAAVVRLDPGLAFGSGTHPTTALCLRWLDALAEVLAARTAPGGRIAMSGILAGQEDELLERFAPWFGDLATEREGDWIRIDGRRRQGAPA
jgi:ribosomal protein L11 methyltransferase